MMDTCVVLIKPDGMQRGLIGEVISRFEQKGLLLIGAKMIQLNDTILDAWYEHHKDKPFFPSLKSYMMRTPIVAMVWQGVNTAETIRTMLGPTDPKKALSGTIRGDFGMSVQYNLVHASESREAAEKEISLIFTKDEIFNWQKASASYTYSEEEIG